MSCPTLSSGRSRSPVLSIETLPVDQEHQLRAEIAAAKRTQLENRRQCSWHSPSSKKGNRKTLKQEYPRVLPAPSRKAVVFIPPSVECNGGVIESDTSGGTRPQSSPALKRSPEVRRLWRKLTQVKGSHADTTSPCSRTSTPKQLEKEERRKAKSLRIAQEARLEEKRRQFTACVEQQIEEKNKMKLVEDHCDLQTRRSVSDAVRYRIGNAKDFVKTKSKRIRPRSYKLADQTPHIDDFTSKQELIRWLAETHTAADEHLTLISDSKPAELSPLLHPAELDSTEVEFHNDVGSIRPTHALSEPPQYSTGPKKLVEELGSCGVQAEEDPETSPGSVSHFSPFTTRSSLVCSMCRSKLSRDNLRAYKQHASGEPVTCSSCTQQRCSIEVSSLSPSHSESLRNYYPFSSGSTYVDVATSGSRNVEYKSELPLHVSRSPSMQDQAHTLAGDSQLATSLVSSPSSPKSEAHLALESIRSAHIGMLKQMEQRQREQDFRHREQEVMLREREATLRDQQSLFRERELLAREKEAMVTERLLRDFDKNSYIGAQFSTPRHSHKSNRNHMTVTDTKGLSEELDAISLDCEHKRCAQEPLRSQAVADAEVTILAMNGADPHVRSHAAQKRKSGSRNASFESKGQMHTSSNSGPSKRAVDSDGDGNGEEDGDDDERDSPKKLKPDTPQLDGPQRLFACPYYKKDPTRFSALNTVERQYRGCAGHYLPDISRLKQHLRRVHWRPENYCQRCFEVFDSGAKLGEHAQSTTACAVVECPFPEKMDKSQQDKIHVKRPRISPEVVWSDIFRALFPDTPLPDSPYAANNDLLAPSSAVHPTMSHQEAIRMVSKLFNERLDKGVRDYIGLSDPSERSFLSQALDEAMLELLDRFALTPTPSPTGPSSLVPSPVLPSGSSRRSSALDVCFDQNAVPAGSNASTQTGMAGRPQKLIPQHTPKLREPTYQLKPALSKLPMPTSTMPFSSHQANLQPDGNIFLQLRIPEYIRQDQGWDDGSHSFESGDDNFAMMSADGSNSGPQQQMGSRSSNTEMALGGKPRQAKPIETVSANTQPAVCQPCTETSAMLQLQCDKRAVTAVDSGYGSQNSRHHGSDACKPVDEQQDQEMHDIEPSPIGHVTFEEELQNWLDSDENKRHETMHLESTWPNHDY